MRSTHLSTGYGTIVVVSPCRKGLQGSVTACGRASHAETAAAVAAALRVLRRRAKACFNPPMDGIWTGSRIEQAQVPDSADQTASRRTEIAAQNPIPLPPLQLSRLPRPPPPSLQAVRCCRRCFRSVLVCGAEPDLPSQQAADCGGSPCRRCRGKSRPGFGRLHVLPTFRTGAAVGVGVVCHVKHHWARMPRIAASCRIGHCLHLALVLAGDLVFAVTCTLPWPRGKRRVPALLPAQKWTG